MRINQSTKRFISLIFSLVMLLMAIIVFNSLVRPAYEEAQGIKAELIASNNFLKEQRTVAEEAFKLKSAYQGERELVDVVSLALPPTKKESEVAYLFDQLARLNRLSLGSFSISASGALGGGRERSGIIKQLGTVNINTQLVGTYEDFKLFLRGLETNIRILDVKTLGISSISGIGASTGLYTFSITVVTYYHNP